MEATLMVSQIIQAVRIIFCSHLFLISVLLFLGLCKSYSNISLLQFYAL